MNGKKIAHGQGVGGPLGVVWWAKSFRGEKTTVLLEATLIMQVLVVKISGRNQQHLSAALSQMGTACMIWQVMFGNGAKIGTPAINFSGCCEGDLGT